MEYENNQWGVEKLLQLINSKKINLSPHYQRKDVWPVSAQMKLIDTILKNWPLPSFFVRRMENGSYEMVDGQQRSRAIKAYVDGVISSNDKVHYKTGDKFLNYKLNICEIIGFSESTQVEEFYSLVNSSGLHLNRPELHKAKYYNTRLLKLATVLAQSPDVTRLNLFTKSTINRMNDIDFITELIGGLCFGISDKKLKVDELYEKDISEKEEEDLRKRFDETIQLFAEMNKIKELRATRYRQKNDFYTLFLIFSELLKEGIKKTTLLELYRILCVLSRHISPSQDDCEPLKEYAINCVTQSNGKTARIKRSAILEKLLLNRKKTLTEEQSEVLEYFDLESDAIIFLPPFYTFDVKKLKDADLLI